MGQAKAAVGTEKDDAAVAAKTVEEVGNSLAGGDFGSGSAGHAIGSPLASTNFMMGSPHPVRETAAERLSA